MTRLAAIAACVVAMAACQCPNAPPGADGGADAGGDAGVGDAGVDAGADGGPIPVERICAALSASFCDWALRCGKLDFAQFDDCVALQGWTCEQPQTSGLVAGGGQGYDAKAARACVDALVQSDCAGDFPAADACGAVFTPAVALGGACTRQAGATCIGGYCDGRACPSACAPFLSLDAGCTGDFGDECGPDAYCAFGAPRVCVAVLDAGTACGANDRCAGGVCDTQQGRCVVYGSLGADAGCATDVVCADGLYCRSGACAAREVLGGPCRQYGGLDCASAFTCRLDGGSTGSCQPRAGVGGPCFGLPNDCEVGLVCSSGGTLQPGTCLAFQSQGGACVRAVENCKVGLVCDRSSHCAVLPAVGQPCVRDPLNFRSSDCVGGFCPSEDGGTCQPPQSAGAACARPWECASTYCEGGVCVDACVPN